MLTIDIKGKNTEGKWVDIPLSDTADFTIEQVIAAYDGKDIIMECRRDGKIVGYVCGTEQWRERYRQKGFDKVFSVAEFLTWKRPALEAVIMTAEELAVFGEGCEVVQVGLF